MTPKAYLNQAYRLEQRIRLDQDEINNLRALASDVGSPGFDEHYNPNTPTDAPLCGLWIRSWNTKRRWMRSLIFF